MIINKFRRRPQEERLWRPAVASNNVCRRKLKCCKNFSPFSRFVIVRLGGKECKIIAKHFVRNLFHMFAIIFVAFYGIRECNRDAPTMSIRSLRGGRMAMRVLIRRRLQNHNKRKWLNWDKWHPTPTINSIWQQTGVLSRATHNARTAECPDS